MTGIGSSTRVPAMTLPARVPVDPTPRATATPTEQAGDDGLAPTGPDGWSPAKIVPVTSQLPAKFVGSALTFATGGTAEQPGQRLSTAQVAELAPYYAATFHMDPRLVERELARVYLYVGGPAAQSGEAMTVGQHIYLPDADSVRYILSPQGKRWLSHELSHTMQFIAYDHGSTYDFLDSYVEAMVLGRKPETPGAGGGAWVWGALFTGARHQKDVRGQFGAPSLSGKDKSGMSLLPSAAVGVPLGLVGAGALAGVRSTLKKVPKVEGLIGGNVLGDAGSMTTALGVLALPVLAGGAIGGFATGLSATQQGVAGAAAGAALAAATMWHGDAFAGPLPAKALAGSAIALGAVLGYTTAHISGNTVRGWSDNDAVLHDFFQRQAEHPKFADALHDAHWEEADAEAIAQTFVKTEGSHDYTADAQQYKGVFPKRPTDFSSRMNWGLQVPLLLGVPAAAAVGAGVLATRTGVTIAKGAVDGDGVFGTIGDAIGSLRSDGRGIANSIGVGSAITLGPLIAGALGANVADGLGLDNKHAVLAGTATAAVTSGVVLSALLHGSSSSLLTLTPKVFAGMAVAAGVGYLSANLAVHAAHPDTRTYDTTRGVHAHA